MFERLGKLNSAFVIPASLFIFGMLVAGAILLSGKIGTTDNKTRYPELRELSAHTQSFSAITSFFKNLAEERGAPYAFNVLKAAPLPPDTDLHLLAHHIGDVLFKTEGADGIRVCTNDFRNACSHSIVVGLFLEQGDSALPEIANICRSAPGGRGAYTMCFHGLGHGILAATSYDLPRTIALCQKTGTAGYQNREAEECTGGAIMETISGGGHDPELWKKETVRYFKDDDPLFPCTADFVPDTHRRICYTYLTPHLFRLAGEMWHPTPLHFASAFTLCERLPERDTENRRACFGGFGKEFIVLAQARDIRKVENITSEQFATVFEWCALAKNPAGIDACIQHTAQSLYWGGENNPASAIRFCGVIADSGHQTVCFDELIGAVGFYAPDVLAKNEFCAKLPARHREECRNKLAR